jgi:hypothetical protein
MNKTRLVWRSLCFHARAHAATLCGVVVATAVLAGALALGDSVRASLARAARNRTGSIGAVIGSGERFFRDDLGKRLAARVPGLEAAVAIQLPAVAALADGSRRIGDAQLLGVASGVLEPPGFFAFGPEGPPTLLAAAHGVLSVRRGPAGSSRVRVEPIRPGDALIGEETARVLGIERGAELVLRVPRPSATSRELALASVEEAIVPLRVRVDQVLGDDDFGSFALEAGAGPRANLFVSREWLAERLGVVERANRVFLRSGRELAEVERALREVWALDDVGLALREAPAASRELVSDQVFLADPLVEALRGLEPPPLGLLTYFVNGIARGERRTPYSTVAALGGLDARPAPDLVGWRAALGEIGADEIVLNDWTARDLSAAVGDTVTLSYFVLGPGRALAEESRDFRLRSIVPTLGIGADPTLAPDFPGIGDAKDCRDWDPGIPIDLEALRDEDEQYWDEHRAAPKGFVTLATARELWANRFGAFTAVRVAAGQEEDALARLHGVDPGALGLPLVAVSAESSGTSDFGGLFLGLSSFLVISALLLTALFFAFSVERRAAELGVLRVTGFAPGEVARMQLGAAGGVALGLGYTRFLLRALESFWSGAVGRTALVFAVEPGTLLLAWGLSVVLGLGAVGLVLRRALRARPLGLLAGELRRDAASPGRTRGRLVALLVLGGIAAGSLVAALVAGGPSADGLAFVAGLAALLAGLLGVRIWLARSARPRSPAALGWTNAARRPGRSLTTVSLMASSVFLLVVAGASRQGPTLADGANDSGTGGFELLGRTSLPVLHDLASGAGREFYGLGEDELAGVEVVPLRVRAGDETSCLNLDQPRRPRLLGAESTRLRGRFRFAARERATDEPWTLLDDDLGAGVVPAIVDATSLQWTLHKALGDELELVDGRGAPFRARVVATLADSILQGDVLIARRQFERLFPDEVGERAFLVDVPRGREGTLAARLSRALADEGLVLVPARERLDLLHGVQNTYLAIFQALGGLGLVLGSAGCLALVLRSAIERRGELALLQAVGFSRGELRLLFLGEQGGLVWAGLLAGALAGTLVVLPRLEPGSLDALRTLAGLLAAVAVAGVLWVWLGSLPALRGSALEALKRE